MSSLSDLRPGDIMFGPIGGLVPGVVPIAFGQILLAAQKDRLTWRTWWRVRHVAVVVESAGIEVTPAFPEGRMISKPRIVQAMPRGAEEIEIGIEHWTDDYIFLRPPYTTYEEESGFIKQGQAVANAARKHVGTPYSFLDYAAILGRRMGIKNGWLRRYVKSTGHMICSQLADQAMCDASYHVFNDGRWSQDVTPADLYRMLLSTDGVKVIHP